MHHHLLYVGMSLVISSWGRTFAQLFCSPHSDAHTIDSLLKHVVSADALTQSPAAALASAACCLSLLVHHTAQCAVHAPAFLHVFGSLIPLLSLPDVSSDMERVVYTGLTTCASLQPDLLDKCMRMVFDTHTSARSNSGQARGMQSGSASALSPLTFAVCEVRMRLLRHIAKMLSLEISLLIFCSVMRLLPQVQGSAGRCCCSVCTGQPRERRQARGDG
jgi:hypothetical protein